LRIINSVASERRQREQEQKNEANIRKSCAAEHEGSSEINPTKCDWSWCCRPCLQCRRGNEMPLTGGISRC